MSATLLNSSQALFHFIFSKTMWSDYDLRVPGEETEASKI